MSLIDSRSPTLDKSDLREAAVSSGVKRDLDSLRRN